MFAIAVWDPRSQELHLVRDRVGVKPVYLYREGGTVYFASEVRALLEAGVAPRRLDPAGVAGYLWHGFVHGPGTIIEGVSLLPAGTHLTLAADDPADAAPEPVRYWHPPDGEPGTTTVEEAKLELERSVRMRLIADVPLGVFLSGGIDSAAVTALAVRSAPDTVHTYNIGFETRAHDESAYAAKVAQALGHAPPLPGADRGDVPRSARRGDGDRWTSRRSTG